VACACATRSRSRFPANIVVVMIGVPYAAVPQIRLAMSRGSSDKSLTAVWMAEQGPYGPSCFGAPPPISACQGSELGWCTVLRAVQQPTVTCQSVACRVIDGPEGREPVISRSTQHDMTGSISGHPRTLREVVVGNGQPQGKAPAARLLALSRCATLRQLSPDTPTAGWRGGRGRDSRIKDRDARHRYRTGQLRSSQPAFPSGGWLPGTQHAHHYDRGSPTGIGQLPLRDLGDEARCAQAYRTQTDEGSR
jgi:hypothetical protein